MSQQVKHWRITFRDQSRPPVDIKGHIMFEYNLGAGTIILFPDEPETTPQGSRHAESVCAIFPLDVVHDAQIIDEKDHPNA